MNKPTGATTQILQQACSQPRFRGKLLGIFIALLGAIALEIPVTPALASAPCTTMQLGDRGASVKALQQTLSNNGYNIGAIDGVFGEQTKIIIISFQRQNNLDPDGVVGGSTCTALIKLKNSELVAASSQTTSPVTRQPKPSSTPSTASTSGTILKKGDKGPEVTALQNALKARGFTTLVVTGIFDQATQDTVKRLQLLDGLPDTGVMDQPTKNSLNAYLDNQLNMANGNQNPVVVTAPPVNTAPPAPPIVPVFTPTNPINTSPQNNTPPDIIFSTPAQTAQASTSSNGDRNQGIAYVVAVPVRGNETLSQVQRVIPQAVMDRAGRGRFVNAGVFRNRYDAESISDTLKARGLDARVFVP